LKYDHDFIFDLHTFLIDQSLRLERFKHSQNNRLQLAKSTNFTEIFGFVHSGNLKTLVSQTQDKNCRPWYQRCSIAYGWQLVTRLMRWVPLVEQELLTLPEHLSSPPDFSGVYVSQSLVLCVCFVDCCLSFCTFSFGHCVVCSSSIYWFWLLL
jgi:hypothetical protein